MRQKTFGQLETQYKRMLKEAFPKLKFHGITWNWYKVYKGEPFDNPGFVRIHKAFKNSAEKRRHPFYS